MDLQNSRTAGHLLRAWAGESQARNRYAIAADALADKGQIALSRMFLFTAEEERAHAAVFWNLLSPLAGQNAAIDGTYPIEKTGTAEEFLRYAQHNETEEAETVYPAFAAAAEEEGFLRAAAVFRAIAAIEAVHAARFARLAALVSQGKLYTAEEDGTAWLCLHCGHIHHGRNAPGICPVCAHGQGYFLRASMAPYTDDACLSAPANRAE